MKATGIREAEVAQVLERPKRQGKKIKADPNSEEDSPAELMSKTAESKAKEPTVGARDNVAVNEELAQDEAGVDAESVADETPQSSSVAPEKSPATRKGKKGKRLDSEAIRAGITHLFSLKNPTDRLNTDDRSQGRFKGEVAKSTRESGYQRRRVTGRRIVQMPGQWSPEV